MFASPPPPPKKKKVGDRIKVIKMVLEVHFIYCVWKHVLSFNHFNPLPDNILNFSKLKQIADDILKCI